MPNSLALVTSSSYPNTAYIATTTSGGSSTTGNAALDVVNISTPSAMQGVEQVTVANAAIFLGFGYDGDLLLATGNTTSFRNPGVPDFNIAGNLTLSTMNITNVESPVGTANVTTQIPTTGTYVVQPLAYGSGIFAIVNDPAIHGPRRPEFQLDDRGCQHAQLSGAVSFHDRVWHDGYCRGRRLSFGSECERADDLHHCDAFNRLPCGCDSVGGA